MGAGASHDRRRRAPLRCCLALLLFVSSFASPQLWHRKTSHDLTQVGLERRLPNARFRPHAGCSEDE